MEENGSIDHKYRDVYVYAVQTVFVYIFNILSGVAIGIAMGEVLPCILFLIAVIPLREHAGGYHASMPIRMGKLLFSFMYGTCPGTNVG